MEDSFDWISSHSTEIEKSIAYASGPDEDKVIFTAVPFDVHYYTIVSSPEPADVGNIMAVNVPREMETLSVSRTFYNENNGDNPDIDETVLSHSIGDVSSYPTAADRDALIGTGPEAQGLVSDGTPVGIGTGSITVTISKTEGQGEGTFNEFSTTIESEVGVGGVTFGTSAGFSYGYGYTITNSEFTFYEGTVGDIPDATYTPDLLYTFGLFTYPLSNGGQSFAVVNYWTE